MKVLLMHPVENYVLPEHPLPNEEVLVQDLELDILFSAMSKQDQFVYQVIKKTILSDPISLPTIHYRQEIVKDCLGHSEVVKQLYQLLVQASQEKKRQWMGIHSNHPTEILNESVRLLYLFFGLFKKLRKITDIYANTFNSQGFTRFFSMIQEEIDEVYLAEVKAILHDLRFDKGILVSAELGEGIEGSNYVLRKEKPIEKSWIKRVFETKDTSFSFTLDPRDNFGFQALSELRDVAVNQVSNVVAQSADHIDQFFKQLQLELAFYIGCINLFEHINQIQMPITFPVPKPMQEELQHSFSGLYDISLALTMNQKIVTNTLDLSQNPLIMITGANQGGKSTFLRSVGITQLMMQSGMFVPAETYTTNICSSLFTHYVREEDTTMKMGKLDEELGRMSLILNHLSPHALLLCNESFASTNESEGSEIAKGIINGLLVHQIKIFFVTHLFTCAEYFYSERKEKTAFLRAIRLPDGTRSYRLQFERPLQTSYGKDLYYNLFKPSSDLDEGLTHDDNKKD